MLQDIILFREENAEEYRETPPIPFGAFTATLERLTMGRYEIRVVSENSAGRGPPSVLQVFRVGDIGKEDRDSLDQERRERKRESGL